MIKMNGNYRHSMRIIIVTVLIAGVFGAHGCFTQSVQLREPLPDINWPKPPETPRIRFVNAISTPEDINIKGIVRKFLHFLKGTKESSITTPYGLETDNDGRLFVVDTFNRFVHVFDIRNRIYYTFPQKETSFVSPIDIAIDKKGNIFVTDSKEAVIKIFNNHGKKYIREIGKGILKRPTGIAVNEKTGELLVVDTLSSQVIRYDLDTYRLKGIIGKSGIGEGMLHYPTNIFVTPNGFIFISDSLNFRIQIFTPEGRFLHAYGKPGDSPGYFSRPKGVAVDSDGNIYIVDALFDNVQIFDKNGKFLMDFGGPGNNYGEFWLPSGIFIDGNDTIYISDSYNNRVQIFQYIKKNILLK